MRRTCSNHTRSRIRTNTAYVNTALLPQITFTPKGQITNAFVMSFGNCLQVHLSERQIVPQLDPFSGQWGNQTTCHDDRHTQVTGKTAPFPNGRLPVKAGWTLQCPPASTLSSLHRKILSQPLQTLLNIHCDLPP